MSRAPDEDEMTALMRLMFMRLGPIHPLERLNIPPMVKGQDIEVPMFTLNETLLAFKKDARS